MEIPFIHTMIIHKLKIHTMNNSYYE